MAYYLKNEEKNGIEIYFDGKPSDEVLVELKANHWRWFPPKNCWYNRFSEENESFAKNVCNNDPSEIAGKVEDDEIINPSKKQPETTGSYGSSSAPQVAETIKYPSSKYQVDERLIKRDKRKESKYGIDDIKIYAYYEDVGKNICIIGEIWANKKPSKDFCIICTIYDKDGDILETKESSSYGSGLVTSMIKPETFFNGFPFKFYFIGVSKKDIGEILIAPADSY